MAASEIPCGGSLSKEMKKLLKQHPNFEVMPDKPRVKCSLSGHEMPCQVEAIQNYIKGKKFQKLCAQNQYNYEKFKEHIVSSNKKGREHQLFCLLTLRHINNNPEHIKRHIEGRKFKRAHARWEECQKTGEKFQPISRKRKNFDMDMEEASNEEEAGSDVDSLSDLYPGNVEEDEEEDSASDFEFEDMEEENKESSPVKNHKGTKRKQTEGKKKKKNVKKKKT